MPYRFGSRSRANLAKCHPALRAVAERALEISAQDFTVTAGDDLCLAVAPYPPASPVKKFRVVAEAFKRAAREANVALRWSGDFRFFDDLTRFEIDASTDGQQSASSQTVAPTSVPAGETDGSSLTTALRAEYDDLFSRAAIRPERQASVLATAQRMADADHWPRYVAVSDILGAPPHLVALIHAMEAGLDFSRHLHNGDSLTGRTKRVPKGRPVVGCPPFTWEESALDALRLLWLGRWSDWSVAGLCYVLERYNGWGYRRHHSTVPSPYLWSFTTVYTQGKYTSDGYFDAQAVSRQAGAMALLRGLAACSKPFPGLDGDLP